MHLNCDIYILYECERSFDIKHVCTSVDRNNVYDANMYVYNDVIISCKNVIFVKESQKNIINKENDDILLVKLSVGESKYTLKN